MLGSVRVMSGGISEAKDLQLSGEGLYHTIRKPGNMDIFKLQNYEKG